MNRAPVHICKKIGSFNSSVVSFLSNLKKIKYNFKKIPCVQNLQVKMRGRGFPWTKLLMVLLVFAAGFVAHDVRSHGSFEGRLSSPGAQHTLIASKKTLTVLSPSLSFSPPTLRFGHSQTSSQLGGVRCVSAGLGQNNRVHQTGVQVRAAKTLGC